MSDYFGAMGTALFSKLSAGTALTGALGGTLIYADVAPDNAAVPFVVFSHQAGGPENMIPADDMRSDLWYVRAWANSRKTANRLDGLVSDLLHRGSVTVAGWTCIWLAREENIAFMETLPNGEKRYTAGGTYRIRLS